MVRKIPFKVVFASDEDSDFPASELNNHNPAVYGWRSSPKPSNITTKEIVLRFQTPSKISKIQVLVHQYLIPERIEIWLHYSPKAAPSTPSSQSFEYLGFVSLSNNSATNYQSRELQSVSVVPKIGTHLKLRLSAPHKNDLNKDEQISLIAVNILGEEIKPEDDGGVSQLSMEMDNELNSICDDLSFSMYVEESVAELVRELEKRKHKAVSDERFEYARKLKLCMNSLKNAGERLGRYALAKRQAVQQEDFNTARLRKEQIELYKKSVFEALQIDRLLEKGEVISENDACSQLYSTKPVLPSPPSLQDVANVLASETSKLLSIPKEPEVQDVKDNKPETPKQKKRSSLEHDTQGSPLLNRSSPSNGSLRRRNKSVPRNNYEDYDERAIPTLRHSHTNEFLRECHGNTALADENIRGRSKLNDRERRQATIPILVFGNEMVELFYSRQFQDREEGLTRLRDNLKNYSNEDQKAGPNKTARAATFLLHRCVRDAVFSVFSQATETVRCLFTEFIHERVSLSEVARSVDKLLPELLAKSGDASARVNTLAQHTILTIAACLEVKEQHLIAPALSRAVSNGTHPRLALSRMQMLEQLVLSQGINTDKQSGLHCRTLSETGISGIHHPSEPVRKVAERVLILVYKVNPRLVRKQLPPDDDVTRRNLLYRQLFAEFDKIDLMRKKEMYESRQHSVPPFGMLSPPLSSSSKSSPPLDRRSRAENRGNVSFASDKASESIENKILKSKSGNAIDAFLRDVENHTMSYNGTIDRRDLNRVKNSGQHLRENGSSRKSSNSDSCSTSEHENKCPFCDWVCVGDTTNLDRHYWKTCPMLMRCPQCSQALEVSALNSHLITDCDAKDNFRSCERCFESVHRELYDYHLLEDYCIESMSGAERCPLCHDSVTLPYDGGWKRHLLNLCQANTRRKSKN